MDKLAVLRTPRESIGYWMARGGARPFRGASVRVLTNMAAGRETAKRVL
jgi:hypothetical protein